MMTVAKLPSRLRRAVACVCVAALLSPGAVFAAPGAPAAAPAAGQAAAASPAAARATFLRGRATWALASGEAGEISQGLALPDGVSIRTYEGALLKLELKEGNELILGPNSDISLDVTEEDGGWVSQVGFFGGLLRGLINKLGGNDRLEVVTSNAVAAVKGTDFEMELEPLDAAPAEETPAEEAPAEVEAAPAQKAVPGEVEAAPTPQTEGAKPQGSLFKRLPLGLQVALLPSRAESAPKKPVKAPAKANPRAPAKPVTKAPAKTTTKAPVRATTTKKAPAKAKAKPLTVKVLSSAKGGVLLGSKNGRTAVRVPAGAKAKLSASGKLKTGLVSAKDIAKANAAAKGAARAATLAAVKAGAAKVKASVAAMKATLGALKTAQANVEKAQRVQLAAVAKKYGANSPQVKALRKAQQLQVAAARTYLRAFESGLKSLGKLKPEQLGSPAVVQKLLARQAQTLQTLLVKVETNTSKAEALAGNTLSPGTTSPRSRTAAPPSSSAPGTGQPGSSSRGSSLLQLARQAIQEVRQEAARQVGQDRQSVRNDQYAGTNFIDRKGYRVQLSQVVLRPDAATVQKMQFTERSEGPDKGQSLFSHRVTYNQALPTDWTTVVERPLNDPANLGGGTPAYYRLSEQVAMRSPAACLLCVTQQYDLPQQLAGQWKQGYIERFGVQGLDKGYVRYDALGALVAGSDSITVSVVQESASQNLSYRYFNNTLNEEIFTAKVWLVDGKGGFTAPSDFAPGPPSTLRAFNLGHPGKYFELSITAPGFLGREIDVMLPSSAFLDAF